MMVPPQDPTKVRQIPFLDAVEDEKGHVRNYYILQHALKNYPLDYFGWQIMPQGAFVREGFKAEAAKFESDKARYLETGELPEDY